MDWPVFRGRRRGVATEIRAAAGGGALGRRLGIVCGSTSLTSWACTSEAVR